MRTSGGCARWSSLVNHHPAESLGATPAHAQAHEHHGLHHRTAGDSTDTPTHQQARRQTTRSSVETGCSRKTSSLARKTGCSRPPWGSFSTPWGESVPGAPWADLVTQLATRSPEIARQALSEGRLTPHRDLSPLTLGGSDTSPALTTPKLFPINLQDRLEDVKYGLTHGSVCYSAKVPWH